MSSLAICPLIRKTVCIRTSFRIALEAQHDLRRTIPSRSHILSHVSSIFLGVNREASSQAEIADFKLAVGVHEEIAWFEIAVEDIGAVDVFEATEDLVDEGLEVGVGQRLAGANDGG